MKFQRLKKSISPALLTIMATLPIISEAYDYAYLEEYKGSSDTYVKDEFKASYGASVKLLDRCSRRLSQGKICTRRTMMEDVHADIGFELGSSNGVKKAVKLNVNGSAMHQLRPSAGVTGDKVFYQYRIYINGAWADMNWDLITTDKNGAKSYKKQTLWTHQVVDRVKRRPGIELNIPQFSSVVSELNTAKTNCNATVNTYISNGFRKYIRPSRSNWYKAMTLGQAKANTKQYISEYVNECAPNKKSKLTSILSLIDRAQYATVDVPSLQDQNSKEFFKTFSGNFNFDVLTYDIKVDASFNAKSGYTWSYDLNPVTLMNLTATPSVVTDAAVSASHEVYSIKGTAKPFVEVALPFNAFFNGSNLKIQSEAQYRLPNGKFEACASVLCTDVYKFKNNTKTKPLMDITL